MTPVAISTKGYCQETLLLHFRHLPFRAKKLKIGTRSYQESFSLQERQMLRPPKERAVL